MALKPKEKRLEKKKTLFTCNLAGFGFYDGLANWKKLESGQELLYYPDPENRYDTTAIALWLNDDVQLGYIPRSYNESMFKHIEMGWDIYEIRIISLDKEEAANEMVQIAVSVKRNPSYQELLA
jgi:hypothetical protein